MDLLLMEEALVKQKAIVQSELILNEDGSIYHLALKPDDIGDKIILVGDPNRVKMVSDKFDTILLKKNNREFHTHTGLVGDKKISVISTGIGTDNIDIVMNELDALVNIDFETRMAKEELESLDIIRVGTSGSLLSFVDVDTYVVSKFAVSFNTMMDFYDYQEDKDSRKLLQNIQSFSSNRLLPTVPRYIGKCNDRLLNKFAHHRHGITITANGFYGPQGRQVRAGLITRDFLYAYKTYKYNDFRCTNLEMETSGIYAMASLLGHKALSISLILANRSLGTFSYNYKERMNNLIDEVLSKI